MNMKVGFLTSGGDCQSLNAAMRGVAKGLMHYYQDELEIYGFNEGYKGLMYEDYRILGANEFSGILTQGGTMLGTSRQPFKLMDVPDANGNNKIELMKNTYRKLGLKCLVMLGGNGSHKTANRLSEEGLNVITLPKTIDNDLYGTSMTFGFQSAVNVAVSAIDCIHTTADSHRRVFIVEVMGHKVGWLTLHAGIAGGADVILIPEIPYKIDSVIDAIHKRTSTGKRFSIIAVAEGAISYEDSQLSKKALKEKRKKSVFPTDAYAIANQITAKTGEEVRVTIPGHTQRGGVPSAFDRVISSRLGATAAEFIYENKFGVMVGMENDRLIPVPLSEVAGRLKMVNPNDKIIHETKLLGISFGE